MYGQTRVRDTSYSIPIRGVQELWNGSSLSGSYPTNTDLWEFKHCEDRINEYPLLHRPQGQWLDIGGPFLSLTVKNRFPVVSNFVSSGPMFGVQEWLYKGPVIAHPQAVFSSPVPMSTWNTSGVQLDSLLVRQGLGATAISRCKPASPEASFGVFLSETYREGIPRLLSNFRGSDERIDYFRSLGSNYLNVEFGWKPFVSDLRKTARAIQSIESTLEDLRRNSGKRMRRHYEFPSVDKTSVVVDDNTLPFGAPPYTYTQARRTITAIESKKTWFDGEFIYRFPSVDASIPRKISAGARSLLGLDLTPETLWNAAPWTWLADWFANTGDILANVSAISSDDLVMRYGYLMQEVEVKLVHTHHGVSVTKGSIPSTFSGTSWRTAKSRIGASPYGFGPTWDSFSPRQVAILTSIGITRRGRS